MMAKAETATNKLYEMDSELYSFEARVIACEPSGEGRFAVELDQTAFFPEGGGQYADRGTLSGAVVYDVQITDERILQSLPDALRAPSPFGLEKTIRRSTPCLAAPTVRSINFS